MLCLTLPSGRAVLQLQDRLDTTAPLLATTEVMSAYTACLLRNVLPCICAQLLGHTDSLETAWTMACQASLSMGFSRPNTGVGCHFLLQGIFPTQGWNPGLLPWQRGFFTTEPPGKPALICANLHDFVVDKMNVIFYIRLVPFKARAPLIAQL